MVILYITMAVMTIYFWYAEVKEYERHQNQLKEDRKNRTPGSILR